MCEFLNVPDGLVQLGRVHSVSNGVRMEQPRGRPALLSSFMIFVLFLALVAMITIYAGVKTVPQGSVWTVERFGRYHALLYPGLNLIVPFIDRIGRRMNVMESVLA